jgi:glutamate-1-semialdehyde 2,1-aminomutase
VTLSWVGTGRCLASLDFTDDDYTALTTKLLKAAARMRADGWWVTTTEFPERNRLMQRQLRRDVLGSLVPVSVWAFYEAVMRRKHDDHHASHNNAWNQYLHLVSSSTFIYCYAILFADLTQAMFLGLAALFVRQFGHAVLEPACHSAEERLLGFTTRNKTLIVGGFAAIPLLILLKAGDVSLGGFIAQADTIALQWFRYMLAVVLGRVAFLSWKFDLRTASIWFVKLVTDPFTDLMAYRPWRPQGA